MQVKRNYSFYDMVNWTKWTILFFSIYHSIIVALYHLADFTFLALPWLPMSVIGIAVAFFVGFKNNSSYDRQWEARKIYGAIVNSSRSWGMMVLGFVTDQFATISVSPEEVKSIHKQMILRHIAWLTALRYQLRTKRSWEHNSPKNDMSREWLDIKELKTPIDEELKPYLTEEDREYVLSKKNRATHLLNLQSLQLKKLRSQGLIDDFRHVELENMLIDFFTQQGKCERIKNYPFPRQYASTTRYLSFIFMGLIPFGVLGVFADMGDNFIWLAIPFGVLVSWTFYVIEKIGDYSENPFEGLHNDVPITALSRTIEIDMLEMLDETELPEPVTAHKNYLS